MVSRIEQPNQIFLGGKRFKTRGRVQADLISTFPAKVTIGDVTKDSHPRASVLGLSDWRSGIGLYRSEEAATVDRAWWSTLNLRHKNNLVLQRLGTATASAGVSGKPTVLFELNEFIFGCFGKDIRRYSDNADTWYYPHTTANQTLNGYATDAVVCRLNGTLYTFIAYGNGYAWSNFALLQGFNNDDEDMIYLAYWDEKIWGIDESGQLKFSTFLSTGDWANDAQLPLPNGSVTALFEGKDATGASVLYCMTKYGLYVHNFERGKFEPSQALLPRHPNNGIGSTRWRDNIYIPAGNSIYRYADGSSNAVVSLVGPDKDDGLPSGQKGTINRLVASHNELIATIDGTTAPTTTSNMFAGSESPVMFPSTGLSSILAWDESGWQVLWNSSTAGEKITTATVAAAYNTTYRLWWAQDATVYYMDLPTDIVNPDQVTTTAYAASGVHETPWFNFGQDDVSKLASVLDMVVSGITTTETITVSYGTNLDTTYTELKVINVQPSDGHVKIVFPSTVTPKGVAFQWIRFKFDFARGATTTLTPKLHGCTFTFRKKLPVKLGFTVTLDLTEDSDAMSPHEQRYEIKQMMIEDTLKEFSYRSDSEDSDEWRTYWVDIISATNMENTGLDETGQTRITLAEL